MKSKPIKISVTATVLLAALFGLMYTTISEGTEYYMHVDEVMANPSAWHGKRLQLHGHVVEKSIEKKRGASLDYRFKVQSNGAVVQAFYSGVVPDNFKDGAEVVIKGTLGPDGFKVDSRNGIMAKCPSKYEAKGPGIPGS
jgi:cytochrome c-type biogenesis protein CcmE